MKAPSKEHIFRIKEEKVKGYLVRVVSTVNGKITTATNEMFCEEDYCNKKKTLSAAQKHRDKVIKESINFDKKGRMGNKGVFHKVPSARNKTGIVGVQFKDADHFHGYIAAWQEEGKTKTKTFSSAGISNKKARKLAIAYRLKMEQLHYRR